MVDGYPTHPITAIHPVTNTILRSTLILAGLAALLEDQECAAQ